MSLLILENKIEYLYLSKPDAKSIYLFTVNSQDSITYINLNL